jgi:hypothetical protein
MNQEDIKRFQSAISEILSEAVNDLRHYKELSNPDFQHRIIFGLPAVMAKQPEKFNTEWNRPLNEQEINEMRMLTKGIRLKPFNKDELFLIEKRDMFLSNLKALIVDIYFAKKNNR